MAKATHRTKVITGNTRPDYDPDRGSWGRQLSPDHPVHLLDALEKDSPAYCRALQELTRLRFLDVEITVPVMQKVIERAKRIEERDTERQAALEGKARLVDTAEGSVVYYMRIGNRIKIGTTTNLPTRLASINPEELMAIEPGGVEKERSRHVQFAHLRTHGEWFRDEPELRRHIEKLRKRTDDPAS